jgi:hypothetical protein
MLFTKFGLQITFSAKNYEQHIHLQQLFIAMQYHTKTKFDDSVIEKINLIKNKTRSKSSKLNLFNIFHHNHIISYSVPHIKTNIKLVGELGKTLEFAESFLINGLYSEATSIFQLKYVSLSLINKLEYCSIEHFEKISITIYKLALCQYLSGILAESEKTLKKYGSACRCKYSYVLSRMLTLLMCVEFKLGFFFFF